MREVLQERVSRNSAEPTGLVPRRMRACVDILVGGTTQYFAPSNVGSAAHALSGGVLLTLVPARSDGGGCLRQGRQRRQQSSWCCPTAECGPHGRAGSLGVVAGAHPQEPTAQRDRLEHRPSRASRHPDLRIRAKSHACRTSCHRRLVLGRFLGDGIGNVRRLIAGHHGEQNLAPGASGIASLGVGWAMATKPAR